ncbi:SKP1 component [Trypanosoma melophagium]|uniref:SKP1 component n=1 Tax=Trypanosoma melophagium TaxID=715481 RepID=UPI00351AA034|nr:SKP1 component [Trypanosoma melophagium]
MSACDVTLNSVDGVAVTLPAAIAWKDIGLLESLAELDEGNQAEMPLINLDFPAAVVKGIATYLLHTDRRSEEIPKPLTVPLQSCVKNWEMEFVKEMERSGCMMSLLECSCYLRVHALQSLLSAYVAQRIREVAMAAPSIMEGAEDVRRLLHIENEWTQEEMVHLEREMRYAKEIDPNVY